VQNSKLQLKTKNFSGFTLIELIVAIGVFMVVMTITLAAFLNIADIQKKTEAFRKVNDNLNFAIEAMMREIREGRNYSCSSGDCSLGSGNLTFKNKNEDTVTYSLNETDKYIQRYVLNADGSEETYQITASGNSGVTIENLSFIARGIESDDTEQPIVTILISGFTGDKVKLKSELHLQATVSQRKLDS